MRADKDIRFGEIIVKEEPFVTYLYNNNYNDFCHNCFKSIDNRFVPCLVANQIRFANQLCLKKCWINTTNMNAILCYSSPKRLAISYIVLRIVFRTGIRDAIQISKEIDENSKDGQNSPSFIAYHWIHLLSFSVIQSR